MVDGPNPRLQKQQDFHRCKSTIARWHSGKNLKKKLKKLILRSKLKFEKEIAKEKAAKKEDLVDKPAEEEAAKE